MGDRRDTVSPLLKTNKTTLINEKVDLQIVSIYGACCAYQSSDFVDSSQFYVPRK